jgi:uncharacterized protein (TIGR03067 family)
MMNPSLLIGLALAVSAPAKDAPKKEALLVGEWVAEKMVMDGLEVPVGPGVTDLRLTFGADGTGTSQLVGAAPYPITYKADAKKDPPEIDLLPQAGKSDEPGVGVYRLDGDTLVLCLAFGKGAARPKKFASPAGSDALLITLKRVKKKD